MSKKLKSDLLFDNGVDSATKRLFLNGDVDEALHTKCQNGLAFLNTVGSDDPITIVLSTYGGDVHTALGIYDLIKNNPKPVNILVNGYCMSAGVIILQAAKERISTPFTAFMIHYGSQWNENNWTNVERAVDFNKILRSLHERILRERSKLPKKQLAKWMEEDKFFFADDAIRLGFIDRIESL